MAAPTLEDNDTDPKLNPGQADSDRKFNGIAQNETNREFDSMVGDPDSLGGIDQAAAERAAAAGAVDPNTPIGEQEANNTGANSDFASTFSGKNNDQVKAKGNWKRGGPIGVILGILGVGGFGIATLFSPSLLLVHIQEGFVNKFNTQDTSFTIRTNKIISKKLTDNATSGVCSSTGIPVNILCKYQRPSNRLLNNLNKNGIKAIGADGEIKPTRLGWPNEKPLRYEFTDTAGNKLLTVEAKDFYTTLSTNAEFRAAVHNAFNTRFMGFLDSTFAKIKLRFGFNLSDNINKAKSEQGVTESLNKEVAGADGETNKAASEAADTADTAITHELEEVAEKEVTKLKGASGANAAVLTAGLACMAGDVPQLVIDAERAYQLPQLVKLSAAFLTTAGAIKAGAATPEEVSALGSAITKVVNNKSAMDSFGMKYSLFNDVPSKNNTNYQKFIPGGDAISQFGGAAQIVKNPAIKNTCNIVNNPMTGVAVDSILAGSGLGFVVNLAAGALINVAITELTTPLVKGAVSILSSSGLLQKIMSGFFGDLTQNALANGGEDLGDAFASGAANLMGQTANAGYNMPLSVSQAVAYTQTTKQVQLAYAQEDQATLSPLNATSSNTFLGSLFNKLMPFVTQTGSFGDILSSITSMVASIPSGFLPLAYADDSAAQFTGCTDPSLTGNGTDSSIAVGPFCNIQYGIPPQYLDRDPVDVLNSVSDQIDPQTGEPLADSDLAKWAERCTDGTASAAASCAIVDDKSANYALYMIDHRIQKDLDGEDTGDATPQTSTASVSSSQLYQSSVNIPCAAGTDDAGTAQGYYKGQEIDIHLCSVPNTIDSYHKQPIRVNSVVSANFLALTQAMNQALGTTVVKTTDSFRTMADQQYEYDKYGSPRAATPGTSNHQMGLAVDFQLSTGNSGSTKAAGVDKVYDWLTANASKYDISKLSSEAWHWQAAGAS